MAAIYYTRKQQIMRFLYIKVQFVSFQPFWDIFEFYVHGILNNLGVIATKE